MKHLKTITNDAAQARAFENCMATVNGLDDADQDAVLKAISDYHAWRSQLKSSLKSIGGLKAKKPKGVLPSTGRRKKV